MTTAARTRPHACQQTKCTWASCAERRRAYDNTRHRQIGYGTWDPVTDAEPVRAHLRDLMGKGATLRRIATAANYDTGSLGRILWGRRGEAVNKTIRRDLADRILAVTLPQAGIGPLAETDATGTLRRIQALHATGRPLARIARDFGYHHSWLSEILHATTVSVRTAAHVAARYQALKDAHPESDGVRPQDADRARQHAARLGWHRPAVWDTDIDDPTADPRMPDNNAVDDEAIQRVINGGTAYLTRPERIMAARIFHAERGLSLRETGARLGLTERTILRWKQTEWRVAA